MRCRTTAPARSCASSRPSPASTWRARWRRRRDARFKKGDKVHRARLRHGRRARRRLRRARARARRLGRAPAREHDRVRRDDARHRRLHRGARDPPHAAQRPHARQRPGGRHRRDGRRGLGGGRDPGQARLPRGRDHRQGARRRITCAASAPRRSCCASRSTSPRSGRSTSATFAGAIDNLGGDILAWLAVARRRSAAWSRRSAWRRASSSTRP